jgi:hypothetical protein
MGAKEENYINLMGFMQQAHELLCYKNIDNILYY